MTGQIQSSFRFISLQITFELCGASCASAPVRCYEFFFFVNVFISSSSFSLPVAILFLMNFSKDIIGTFKPSISTIILSSLALIIKSNLTWYWLLFRHFCPDNYSWYFRNKSSEKWVLFHMRQCPITGTRSLPVYCFTTESFYINDVNTKCWRGQGVASWRLFSLCFKIF